ncbi:hypothetical protein [Kitasatospora sp. GP82]|uniref:hypothetical protein n=1 Tax=Kitasatospora sp. GP82 TaxID=3035089 RepID=UPI0024740AAF|nr:hypothetical protein [Kitasatospora sp. GP82]MDH6124181.1 hypothetical protein [Kitasatospora sp. GP82]
MPDAVTKAPKDSEVHRTRPGRLDPALLSVAAALLVAPPLLHLLRADLLTLALLWGLTALQFRSRLTVLDRLALSAGLLTGWCCLLGVLASLWPWGLHPVALAEATVLPLAAAVLTRPQCIRPGFPLADRLLLLAVAAVGWFYLGPLLDKDATGRLAALFHGEDLARHFALYDSVLRFGGYLVFHREQAAVALQDGFQSYPQGSHLVLAVLTAFARGGTATPEALVSLGAFTLLVGALLAACVAAALWAVCRVAGPAFGGWAVLPLCALTGGYLVLVEATPLLFAGFESEIFGLALFALLTALVLRPLARPGEQLLLMGSLTVGLSFVYYLLLGAAVPLLLIWAVVHRRRWRPVRRAASAAAVLTGAAAALPVLANWQQADSASVLAMPGAVYPIARHLLLPLLALTVLGLLTRAARRNSVRRAALCAVLAVAGLALSLREYQIASTGSTAYYYEKLLHQLVVVGVIALAAAVVPLFGSPERRSPTVGTTEWRARAGRPLRALWAGTAAFALLAVLVLNAQPDKWITRSGWQDSSGAVYRHGGRAAPFSAALVTAVNATRPVPDPRIGVLLTEPRQGEDPRFYEGNLWLGVLARDNGCSWRAWIWGRWRRSPQQIVDFADSSSVPLRVYLDDPELAADTERLAGPDRPGRLEIALVRYGGDGRPVVTESPGDHD